MWYSRTSYNYIGAHPLPTSIGIEMASPVAASPTTERFGSQNPDIMINAGSKVGRVKVLGATRAERMDVQNLGGS
jgi:hypothetical protein